MPFHILSIRPLLLFRYRLAPEYPFPAAFDDCVAATLFFMKHASKYGVDPMRIGVAGNIEISLGISSLIAYDVHFLRSTMKK